MSKSVLLCFWWEQIISIRKRLFSKNFLQSEIKSYVIPGGVLNRGVYPSNFRFSTSGYRLSRSVLTLDSLSVVRDCIWRKGTFTLIIFHGNTGKSCVFDLQFSSIQAWTCARACDQRRMYVRRVNDLTLNTRFFFNMHVVS